MADGGEESKIPLTAVIGLTITLAALWLAQEPLKSSRPQIDGYVEPDTESVQARLWQDPIEAVEARAQGETGIKGLESIGFKKYGGKHTGIVFVITEGSPYAENHEKRLRDRYAILSALGVACFRPLDEEHLRYFRLQDKPDNFPIPFEWFKTRRTKHCSSDNASGEDYDSVLIVWVTEDILGETPIKSVHELTRLLAGQYSTDTCQDGFLADCVASVEFKIIGPPTSSMLRTMLGEACERNVPNTHHISLYSPWATAAPDILLHGITANGVRSNCKGEVDSHDLKALLKNNAGISLEYTVESDEEVAIALVRELRRRQVRIGIDRIALISEWDTFYGRALPIIFRAAACFVANGEVVEQSLHSASVGEYGMQSPDTTKLKLRGEECRTMRSSIEAQMSRPHDWDKLGMNVLRYSYLRGLDGMVFGRSRHDTHRSEAGETAKEQKSNRAEETKWDSKSINELERADGQSQLDYLRRLVTRIKDDNDPDKVAPLEAIGILGSDVYDTLLILKAVREEFPGAIFFTTNLDARFLHEGEKKWTRNLVIASPFGLQLQDEIQRDIPPFRDSYQTSAFFAALRALGHIKRVETDTKNRSDRVRCEETQLRPEPSMSSTDEAEADRYEVNLVAQEFSTRICPRLFEIGRVGPVNLSADRQTVLRRIGNKQSVQPLREVGLFGMKPWWNSFDAKTRLTFQETILWFFSTIILMLALFTRYVSKLWRSVKRKATQRDGWLSRFSTWIWTDAAKRHVWAVVTISLCLALVPLAVGWKASDEIIKNILADGWEGEPFMFFDGVSTWPTIAIRVFVVFWCGSCLVKAWYDLRCRHQGMADELGLRPPGEKLSVKDRIEGFFRSIRWIHAIPQSQDSAQMRKVGDIWREYQGAGRVEYRLGRAIILFSVYMIFVFTVVAMTSSGLPFRPCRGESNCAIDHFVMLMSVVAMILLNMFVFDAVMLCQALIAQLKASMLEWPDSMLGHYSLERGMSRKYLSEYLMVRLIADRTHAVHNLVFCPFIALFLMVVSRNRYFDNWDFPAWLIIVWVVYALVAVFSLLMLRWKATEARARALIKFRDNMLVLTGEGENSKSTAEQIRMTIQEIKDIREGAYAPLLRHPAFSASLLAVLSFLQYWLLGQ